MIWGQAVEARDEEVAAQLDRRQRREGDAVLLAHFEARVLVGLDDPEGVSCPPFGNVEAPQEGRAEILVDKHLGVLGLLLLSRTGVRVST